MHNLSKQQIIVYSVVTLLSIKYLRFILLVINGGSPLLDATVTITGFVAVYLMYKNYSEAWMAWVLNDAIRFVLIISSKEKAILMSITCIISLIIDVVIYIKWRKAVKVRGVG